LDKCDEAQTPLELLTQIDMGSAASGSHKGKVMEILNGYERWAIIKIFSVCFKRKIKTTIYECM
jgi:hypothetical protein